MTKRVLVSVVVASLMAMSCSRVPSHEVRTRKDDNAFYLSLDVPELANKCYAPKNNQLNGMLGLPDQVKVNRWVVARRDKISFDYMDLLLSGERKKIDTTVRMTIPRYVVQSRPFYVVITVFDCNAPAQAKGWKGDIVDVIASADLPLPYPPGYREPGAGDGDSADDMMLNLTPAKSEPAQRH